MRNKMKNGLIVIFAMLFMVFAADIFSEPLVIKQPTTAEPSLTPVVPLAVKENVSFPLVNKPNETVGSLLPSRSPSQQSYGIELLTSGYSKAERQQDFVKALNLILAMNSNDPKVVELPEIKVALVSPELYVQRFNYVNRNTTNGKQELFIQINFYPKAINKLLHRTKKVVLVENKPSSLVWLAKLDGAGGKVLDETSDDEIIGILKQRALAAGLSVMLPILDLQDINNISAQDICGENVEKIRLASHRYGSSAVIIGCITGPAAFKSGWSSKWLLFHGGKSIPFVFTSSSAEGLITQAIKEITTNIPNVMTPIAGQSTKVILRITNVESLAQYHEVARYLRTLSHVTQVNLTGISATEVELAVNVLGGKQTLLATLSTQNRLTPNENIIASPPRIDLDYKWVTLDNEKPQPINIKSLP